VHYIHNHALSCIIAMHLLAAMCSIGTVWAALY